MTREEIDILWKKALHESVTAGEQFTRYRFAELVAAAEREECAKACEALQGTLFMQDAGIIKCEDTIRARGKP